MEVPAKKFQRMYPGFEVRLNGAYISQVRGLQEGRERQRHRSVLHGVGHGQLLSGSEGADRKIKGKTLHWVSAADAVPFEARLYEPAAGG